MAFCANCGKEMGEGVKFCPSCGTSAAGGASSAGPEKEKAGNIVKCPNCGAVIPALTAFCPDCGHEFRNVQIASTVKTFLEKLEASRSEEDKLQLIANFPVPNTKEDILEFAIMAESQLQTVGLIQTYFSLYSHMPIVGLFFPEAPVFGFNKAWFAKIRQAYSKARIVLAGDPVILAQIKEIADKADKYEKRPVRLLMISVAVILGSTILLSIIFSFLYK